MQEDFIKHSVPVNEPASCGTSRMLLPIADKRESLVKIKDLLNLFRLENIVLTQTQAVIHNGLPERVVATRETVQDSGDELLHSEVKIVFLLEWIECLHSMLNDARDLLTRVTIEKDNPLID